MHIVRVTYLICSLLSSLSLLGLAVVAPIYLTPGYYWWTAVSLLLLLSQTCAYTHRHDTWGDMGTGAG